MTQSSHIPSPEKRKYLLRNLKKNRLQLQEFGLQLEELLAMVEAEIREHKRKRLQKISH